MYLVNHARTIFERSPIRRQKIGDSLFGQVAIGKDAPRQNDSIRRAHKFGGTVSPSAYLARTRIDDEYGQRRHDPIRARAKSGRFGRRSSHLEYRRRNGHPVLTPENVKRAVLAAHNDVIRTSVQTSEERAKRVPGKGKPCYGCLVDRTQLQP